MNGVPRAASLPSVGRASVRAEDPLCWSRLAVSVVSEFVSGGAAQLTRLHGQVAHVAVAEAGMRHLLFAHRGSCDLSWAGGQHRLGAGSLLITEAGVTVMVMATEFDGRLLSVINERSQAGLPGLDEPSEDYALLPGVYALRDQDQVGCWAFFEALTYEHELSLGGNGRAESRLLHLILISCARAARSSPIVSDRARGANRLARQVSEIIERRFGDHLSLADVAAELSRSPGSVARVTREVTGCSVLELIAERRMREARMLLSGTGLSVAEIATRVGYPSLAYFHRAFRRRTGTTPQRWRVSCAAQAT